MPKLVCLQSRWYKLLVLMASATAWCSAVDCDVLAQDEPATAEADPQYREIRGLSEPPRARVEVPRMLADGTVTNEALFDDFWRYLSAEFTLPEKAGALSDARRDLRRFLGRATGAARQRLLQNLLTNMSAMARDAAEGERNFSPAVRVNAILMIGDLNEREPDFRGAGAIPYPAALPVLIEFLSDERSVNDLNDALRVAALAGILRHAQEKAGPANAAQPQAVRLLQQLAQAETAPNGRSNEVQTWMREQANTILQQWGAPANDAAQATAAR